MQRHVQSLFLLAFAGAVTFAQQTRTEVTKPTTRHDDSKPNSDKVPEVYSISGQLQRVVVLRFKYQADLLAGLQKIVRQEKIRNAVILAGIGSVRNYQIHSVSNREFPSKNIYIKDPTTPADIVSVNGYVVNGEVHAHVTLADAGKAFGGHIEPDTSVFTFAAITLGVFSDDVDLTKLLDKTYR